MLPSSGASKCSFRKPRTAFFSYPILCSPGSCNFPLLPYSAAVYSPSVFSRPVQGYGLRIELDAIRELVTARL